jgi:peptide deformylase
MAVRQIGQYPDARLRLPAQPVSSFDDGLRRLAADLIERLTALSAIGITAPHFGEPSRLYVLRLPAWPTPRLYVNPSVVWLSAETAIHREGSVSMPGIAEEVERAAQIRVEFQDIEGNRLAEEADGFHAACHQHEIDHLDGIFWLQRLSRLRRERAIKRFQKQRRDG